ncbi:MAG: M23 family metallopeptidase [Ruminococcaceae bacterium]|jgi:hypothetical protein|nr:M23 family metallopeptidase [Oscillospiraceae bacterium]
MMGTEWLELHPIFDRYAIYNDHYDGELEYPGDALGRDCMIGAFLPEDPGFIRLYKDSGKRNEDWFSFGARVYAPISGKIASLYINEVTNDPGIQNPSRASTLSIQASDNTVVILGHIQDPVVSLGDTVEEGQLLAYVGNNGYARNPHIHVGAFRGETPLAIVFDPKKVAKVRNRVGELHWLMGISDEEYEKRKKK